MRFINRNLVTIPFPPANAADKAKLSKLAELAERHAEKADKGALANIEKDIDEIVYRLFDLTSDERNYIEASLADTRQNDPVDENDEHEERAHCPDLRKLPLPVQAKRAGIV